MEGASRRAKRKQDESVAQAWHMAMFNAATKSKKGLKPLQDYLSEPRPQKAQTTSDMLAVLQSLKASGAPMNIRQVN